MSATQPKPVAVLKPGLTITAKGVTWTVLKVFPTEVKVQITEEGTGFLRVRTFRRAAFEKNLAEVQKEATNA